MLLGPHTSSLNRTTRFSWKSEKPQIQQKWPGPIRNVMSRKERRRTKDRGGAGEAAVASVAHAEQAGEAKATVPSVTAFSRPLFTVSLVHLSHNRKLYASRARLFCPLLYPLCLGQCQNRERQLQTLQFQKMEEKKNCKACLKAQYFWLLDPKMLRSPCAPQSTKHGLSTSLLASWTELGSRGCRGATLPARNWPTTGGVEIIKHLKTGQKWTDAGIKCSVNFKERDMWMEE